MTTSMIALRRTAGAGARGGVSSRWHTYPWVRFLVRRLLAAACVLGVLTVSTFGMVHLIPGDPALAVLGPSATPEQTASIRDSLRLDDPVFSQLRHYLAGVAHGDLGSSFRNGEPVSRVINLRLGTTLTLAGGALAFVLLLGIPIGMTIAVRAGRKPAVDSWFGALASGLGAVPEYISATVLVIVFALALDLFPVAGADGASSYVLPILALALAPTAIVSRVANRETAVVLRQDYMRAVRAKRLPLWDVYVRHALPNVLAGVLPVVGLLATSLVGSAVVVETVFNLPGLGSAVIGAVQQRDYPVIQGCVLVLGVVACVTSLLVDLAVASFDPRTLEASQ